MKPFDLKDRTREFALTVIRLYATLPKTTEAQVLGKQLLRAGTSVGAHYREAQRGKSDADFISKLEGALQELEETSYWLELLCQSQISSQISQDGLQALLNETEELISIFVVMVNKVKSKR